MKKREEVEAKVGTFKELTEGYYEVVSVAEWDDTLWIATKYRIFAIGRDGYLREAKFLMKTSEPETGE